MLNSLKRLFHQVVPEPLQPPLKCAVRLIRNLAELIGRDMWLPIHRIEQNGMAVLMIGRGACDPYVIRLIFGEFLQTVRVGTAPICLINWKIRRLEKTADLIVFRDRRFEAPSEVRGRMLCMPYFVMQSIDLPPPQADLRAVLRNSSNANDFRKIHKAQFEYEITRDPAHLDSFYQQMYRPLIQSRHLDSADIPGWIHFSRIFKDWELLLIRKDGVAIAGSLNAQHGAEYTLYEHGVLHADRQLIDAGIIGALYWYSFVEAHRRGCIRANLRCARPFLKDGVLAYKKKWSARIVKYDGLKRELRLLFCGGRPAMNRFLEENPFIINQNGRLMSLIILGSHTVLDDRDLAGYLKRCLHPGDGLSTCVVLISRDWSARAAIIGKILAEASQPNRILDLSDGSPTDQPARNVMTRVLTALAQDFVGECR